jgi:hypothetical protein
VLWLRPEEVPSRSGAPTSSAVTHCYSPRVPSAFSFHRISLCSFPPLLTRSSPKLNIITNQRTHHPHFIRTQSAGTATSPAQSNFGLRIPPAGHCLPQLSRFFAYSPIHSTLSPSREPLSLYPGLSSLLLVYLPRIDPSYLLSGASIVSESTSSPCSLH